MHKEQEHKLYIQPSIARSLPAMVRNELSTLSAQKQEEFVEEYKRKQKSLAVAYGCLLILFASHYGYLKRRWMQWLFWLTWWWIVIWWFIDIFRLPWMVAEYNKDIAVEVMRNLKTISH